ncbi:DinB family protein [Lysinibacillus sp. NPDC048646]|uniref:DinB family protein n=1 Tax=Lysinibacillus sp. NPDC048646 TaxID=3390574 RepID=UPI003D067603
MNQDKKQILAQYEKSMTWVGSLANVTEEQWRTPIEVGKWSVAEVIGHLIPWDEFVVSKRIPFLFTEDSLPKAPNIQEMNANAANSSRLQSKEETIGKFLNGRRQLIDALHHLTDEQWQQSFHIGDSELTLFRYFSGLVEHDLHHFLQIEKVLK